jgi:hypothetical protein
MKTLQDLLREYPFVTPRPPSATGITSDTFLDQFIGKSLCEVLSTRVPPLWEGGKRMQYEHIKKIIANQSKLTGKSEDIPHFFENIKEWIGGLKGSSRAMHDSIANAIVSDVSSCSTRAGWLKYTGKVYRGVRVNAHTVKGLEIPDPSKVHVINKGGFHEYRAVMGTYVYQSNLPAQSWSTDLNTAIAFSSYSTLQPTVSLVMEYDIKPNESISLKYLGNYVEREIIKIGKGPIKVKCHIPFAVVGMNQPKGDRDDPFDILLDRKIIKRLPE